MRRARRERKSAPINGRKKGRIANKPIIAIGLNIWRTRVLNGEPPPSVASTHPHSRPKYSIEKTTTDRTSNACSSVDQRTSVLVRRGALAGAEGITQERQSPYWQGRRGASGFVITPSLSTAMPVRIFSFAAPPLRRTLPALLLKMTFSPLRQTTPSRPLPLLG